MNLMVSRSCLIRRELARWSSVTLVVALCCPALWGEPASRGRGELQCDYLKRPDYKRHLTLPLIEEAYQRGKSAYLYGSYQLTIDCLGPLLSPDLLLSNPEELAIAYEYVGLAYFYLEEMELAKQHFKSLIFFRPDHELDPVRVPPDAVTTFVQLRDSLAGELLARESALEEQRAKEDALLEALTKRELIIEQRVNSRLIALLPFGIGQFQNEDRSVGYFFLGSELIATALSVGLFWKIESMRQSNGRFARQELSTARELQSAQLISGGVAVGLVLSGVAHALIFYEPQRPLRRFERPLTEDDIRLTAGDETTDELSSDPLRPPGPLPPNASLDDEGFTPLTPAPEE